MMSVVWMREDIFDPRQIGKQTYVRSVQAGDGVTLTRDASGVFIHVTHKGELQEIWVPATNVLQTLNVKVRGK